MKLQPNNTILISNYKPRMAKNRNTIPAQPAPLRQTAKQPAAMPQPPRKSWPLSIKLCILLAVVSLLVYGNTLNHGYVLDDVMVVKDNMIVQKGFGGIGELLSTPHLKGYINLSNDTYRPLSLVMFAAEYGIWGLNPSVNHFFNILIFAGCVVMLFLFLSKLFNGTKPVVAFIAALLFALHPVHTEIVANIKSRDELLCFFFGFMSLNEFAKYARTAKLPQLMLGMVALFLALLSKETVITFMAIIPLVFFFHLNENKRNSILITGGALLTAGIFLAIRAVVLSKYHANVDVPINFVDNSLVRAPNAASRFATEIWILGDYLKLMFIPYPLVCDHSFNSIPYTTFADPLVLLSIAAYAGMTIFAVMRLIKDKRDVWAFSILFFIITLSLFTNILIPLASTFAERFLFFCSVGPCIAVAAAIDKWLAAGDGINFSKAFSGKALIVLAPLALIYGGMTYARNNDWKDNYTLYKADVDKLPQNTRLNYYIASELQKKYDLEPSPTEQTKMNDESIAYLNKSLAIYRDNTDAQAELGAAYLRAKMVDSSILHLRRALELNPKQSNAAANLGTLYLNQNNFAEALKYYRLTTRLNPRNAVAQFNGGVCFYQLQQYDSAIQYFKNTIAVAPDFNNYKSFQYTAITYKNTGRIDSARRYETLAKEYDPKFQLP